MKTNHDNAELEDSGASERAELSDELIDELLQGGPLGIRHHRRGRPLADAHQAPDRARAGRLGYERGQAPPGGAGNVRNGRTQKTLHTQHGSVRIEPPRDRAGSFEPQIVPKHERRFDGFDERIVAMYARGMSVRDIQAHLEEIYGVEVGQDLISRVTDSVLDDVRGWGC